MDEDDWLDRRFEEHRPHLRAVAHRMLGSTGEAEDAVQEAWLRLRRTDTSDVENLGGWLTTVVARVCLNMLRSRTTRREDPLDTHVADPVVSRDDEADPAAAAALADSVGLALLVVLERLPPAERLAFVLHDMFAVPFDDIAPIVGRSTEATRQLASRGRRRVRGGSPSASGDTGHRRRVVDAFFAAARAGDFEALVAVLDPDAILRVDGGAVPDVSAVVRGASAIASRAMMFAAPDRRLVPVLVDGVPGVVVTVDGRPISVMGFGVIDDRIATIEVLADPERLLRLDLGAADV